MKYKSREEAIKDHVDNYRSDHYHKVFNMKQSRGYYRFAFILSNVPKKSYVLDVGCNGGAVSLKLKQEKKCYVKGIDIIEDLVVLARKRGVFADIGQAEDLSRFKDKTFDVVICSEVLEHLYDPMPAIKEAYRVLKPGGKYIVTFPHPEALEEGAGDFHQKTYNEDDINNMFGGFIDVRYGGICINKIFAEARGLPTNIPQWWGILAHKPYDEEDLLKEQQ